MAFAGSRRGSPFPVKRVVSAVLAASSLVRVCATGIDAAVRSCCPHPGRRRTWSAYPVGSVGRSLTFSSQVLLFLIMVGKRSELNSHQFEQMLASSEIFKPARRYPGGAKPSSQQCTRYRSVSVGVSAEPDHALDPRTKISGIEQAQQGEPRRVDGPAASVVLEVFKGAAGSHGPACRVRSWSLEVRKNLRVLLRAAYRLPGALRAPPLARPRPGLPRKDA